MVYWLTVGVYSILRHFQQYFSYTVVVNLLVEETWVPREKHRPAASHRQTLLHNVVSSTARHERGSNTQL